MRPSALGRARLGAAATVSLVANARVEETENLRKFGDGQAAHLKRTRVFDPRHPPSPQQAGESLKGLVSGEALSVLHLSTIPLEAGAGSTVGPSRLMSTSGIDTIMR